MGLNQAAMNSVKSARIRVWLAPAIVLVISGILELFGDLARDGLRYDRTGISDGELWRLVSGHFVHLGWSHFALNMAGFSLISYLAATLFSARQWCVIGVLTVVAIDAGFWYLQPELIWYVGLSGVLHGLLAAAAINGIRLQHREFWLIAIFLVGKLVYEQTIGPIPGSEGSTGGAVVVAAHLYGAVGGALAGLYFSFRKIPATPI